MFENMQCVGKLGDRGFFTTKNTNGHDKNFMENTTCSHRKSHFHEIFSCSFGHFVVQKEFLAYLGSLTPYELTAGLFCVFFDFRLYIESYKIN